VWGGGGGVGAAGARGGVPPRGGRGDQPPRAKGVRGFFFPPRPDPAVISGKKKPAAPAPKSGSTGKTTQATQNAQSAQNTAAARPRHQPRHDDVPRPPRGIFNPGGGGLFGIFR